MTNPKAGRETRLHDVHEALAIGLIEDAIALAREGLRAGETLPLYYNLAAHHHQVAGDFGAAEALLKKGLSIAPSDSLLLSALGGCLSQQDRGLEALRVYDLALTHAPLHAPAHFGRGAALISLGESEAGKKALIRSIQLAPDYPAALGALADLAMREKNLRSAHCYARQALAADPDEPVAAQTLATIALLDGDHGAAMDLLERRLARPGLSPLHLGALEGLYAEALDAQGRAEDAMAAHVRSHRARYAVHAPLMTAGGVESGLDLCLRVARKFDTVDRFRWAPANLTVQEPAPTSHVFLIGFVRSGTTLLEQVLATHPMVVALEEHPLIRSLARDFFTNDAGIDALQNLSETDAEALRQTYWRAARAAGIDPAGRVFVDKNPLDAIFLPLVARLFPNARIVIARRDPRDVAVSAFRHRFAVNALTMPFLDLKMTAEYYAAVMTLTDLYLDRLPLAVHIIRHEDLVRDFDAVVGGLCTFLGLDWTDTLRDFAETARRRDIRTPSAEQVRRGLSQDGFERWRRYGASINVILPILEPWVEQFGYAKPKT